MESRRVVAFMIVLVAVVTLIAILSAMYAEGKYIKQVHDFCIEKGFNSFDSKYCIQKLGNVIMKKQMYECQGLPPGMVCNLLDINGG